MPDHVAMDWLLSQVNWEISKWSVGHMELWSYFPHARPCCYGLALISSQLRNQQVECWTYGTQEAIEMPEVCVVLNLAICVLLNLFKRKLESHTFWIKSFNIRQLFHPFGYLSAMSIISISFSFDLICNFLLSGGSMNVDDSNIVKSQLEPLTTKKTLIKVSDFNAYVGGSDLNAYVGQGSWS